MELLPEEAEKVNYSAYRNDLCNWFPAAKEEIEASNSWKEFFWRCIDGVPWSDYANIIKTLLVKNKPLLLVTLDYVVLPGQLGEIYNDEWLKGYNEYRAAKETLEKELQDIRKGYKDQYELSCTKYKTEFLSNIKQYNDGFEQGLISGDTFLVKREKAHSAFTALCTEEYNKMNNELIGIESDFILKQYEAWAVVQDRLVRWLLTYV